MQRSFRALSGGILAIAGTAMGDVSFTRVVLIGEAAPGLPAGVSFQFVSDASINSAGDVAFWAQVAGPGVTSANDGSVWRWAGGPATMSVREGAAVPGLSEQVFAAFPRPALNAQGTVSYPGVIVPATLESVPVNIGLFVHDLVPEMRSREGQPAAGLPAGTNYEGMTSAALDDAGGIVWHGNGAAGAWRVSSGGAAIPLVVRGQSAPGLTGLHFVHQPSSSGAGAVLLRASTLPSDQDTGLWSDVAQPPLAVTGSAVAGLPAGVVFDHLSSGPVSCAGGCAAFWARVSGSGVTATNDEVVLVGSAPSPTVAAREGDAAPGTGAAFGPLGHRVLTASSGDAVFHAALTGAGVTAQDNTGLFAYHGGGLELLVREGQAAPGITGVSLAELDAVAMSNTGVLAVVARLRGTGVTPANNRALYLRSASGEWSLAVRTGNLFDTGLGARTVEEILVDSDTTQAGHAAIAESTSGTNLLVKLHFKDPGPNNTVIRSSGLFVATLGAGACYANCDGSTAQPVLNVADFTCFLQRFAAGESYANCDGSTAVPVLNVADFTCFLQRFAAGCR